MHEAAHGLASWGLGYDTFIRVNSSGLISGEYRTAFDADITTLVGPLVTLLQAIGALALALLWSWKPAFMLCFAALLMRVLAAAATLRLPNDEARLGLSWGVGFWTVHGLVIAMLLAITFWIALRLKVGPLGALWRFGVACIALTAIVALEPFLPTLDLMALN